MTAEAFCNRPFTAKSKEVVQRFLQSVVALDDLAWMGTQQERQQEEITPITNAPNFEAMPSYGESLSTDNTPLQETVPSDEVPDSADSHIAESRGFPLASKPLISGFAQLGLVCSVLNPNEAELGQGDISSSSVVKAARRADIVILDWRIGDSYGEVTLEILQEILKGDIGGPRLRLVAIYTGESGLPTILGQVKSMLGDFCQDYAMMDTEPYGVSKGPVRVAIVPKPGSGAAEIEPIPEQDLADLLVNEFVEMTKGILRNVALEGLAALRDHVPKVIAKFDSSLDPGYLGHRILLPNPADAEDHVVEALGAELLSILEDRRPGYLASVDEIRPWLEEKLQAQEVDVQSPTRISGLTKPLEMRVKLVEKGIAGVDDPQPGKNKLGESATAIFSQDAESARKSNLGFAALLGLKTHYPATVPKLTLGTVVRRKRKSGGWRYLMCLQPKCDAVRLGRETGFPFLRLSISNDEDRFGCVILNPEGAWIYLDVDQTPSKLKVVSFSPNSGVGGEVLATEGSGGFCFSDAEGEVYEWVAALKDEHALDVADKVAKKLARPGPNHSEWLRRASQRNVNS